MSLMKRIATTAGVSTLVVSASMVLTTSAFAEESKWTTKNKVDLTTEEAKLGYTFGMQIGANLVGQGINKKIDVNALTAAIQDAAAGIEPRLSQEEMQQAQIAFQQAMQAEAEKARAELEAIGQENSEKGKAFMAKNAKTKGVKTTESGLQYNILREGKGKTPTSDDVIKVHYVGKLIDGTEFDSSYERGQPASFAVAAVIPGFSEGLQLVKEGGKIRLVIPEALAYGMDAPPSIGPNQTLIFEVELLEVTPAPTSKKEG